MNLELVSAYAHKEEVKTLFSEYTDMLIEGDSSFRDYLEVQNYDEELEHLESKYGLPSGRLYLAYYEGELAGCIGLRKIDGQSCEMKRLYVRPQFRGNHIGDYLVKRIIEEAKEIGYSYMLLDTLPFLEDAIHMYKKYGFYEISNYNDSPMDTSIYMKLELKKASKRKLSDHLGILYLITLALIFVGQNVGGFVGLLSLAANTDADITALMYFSFIGIWIVTLAYMRFTKKNRPILKEIGRSAPGNNWRNLLLGIILGFGLNGICILAAWLHGDISLYYHSFRPVYFVIIFAAVFVQSSAEELVCRGFLYQRLRRSYENPAVAIIGNSLLFALLHLFNKGVTVLSLINIFAVGILFSFMVYYMDSIWCAMAAHAAWNFTQNIVFGLPNSGIIAPYSVFMLDTSTANDSFAYNVGFGIEGTVFADVVLIAACVCIYLWGRKKARI